MKVRTITFGSRSERDNYYKLVERWGDKYKIYQNIPFLIVFEVSQGEIIHSTFEYLKKTSIDYVVCDENDKPIIGIEFDGMQQGVNIGDKYVPQKGFNDSRKWRIETKLKIANECGFPLFVFSDVEFNEISDTGLTIADGIIGTILAQKAFQETLSQEKLSEYIKKHHNMTLDEMETLPREDRAIFLEGLFFDIEFDSLYNNDPILREVSKLTYELHILPNINNAKKEIINLSWGALKSWIENGFPDYDRNLYIFTGCTIETERFGIIEKSVLLPRFSIWGGGFDLADNIAKLLALKELKRKLAVDSKK